MKQILLLLTILLGTVIHFQATNAVSHDPPDAVQEVTIYPNPAKDHFMFNSNEEISKISVYNIIGKKVKEFFTPPINQRLNIEDLNQGLYLVEVYNNNGKVLTVQRLKKM